MNKEELDKVRWLVEYKNGASTSWDSYEEAKRHLDEDIEGKTQGTGKHLDPADFHIRPVTFRELIAAGNTIDTFTDDGERISLTEGES